MSYKNYWKTKKEILLSQEECLCRSALALKLSKEARKRLEWFLYHETKAEKNTSLTCRRLGMGRSLFYKWKKRFDATNLSFLEENSRSPKRKRKRVASLGKDTRVLGLRKRYPAYGKEKLRVLYERIHGEPITSWYVQRVIETYYLNAEKPERK